MSPVVFLFVLLLLSSCVFGSKFTEVKAAQQQYLSRFNFPSSEDTDHNVIFLGSGNAEGGGYVPEILVFTPASGIRAVVTLTNGVAPANEPNARAGAVSVYFNNTVCCYDFFFVV